jgi:hypothetical protein
MLISTRREQYWSGAVREVTGGLIVQGFEVADPLRDQCKPATQLFQCSIKFELSVGVSLLRVRPTFIHLGRVTSSSLLMGDCLAIRASSFEVESVSKQFPVDFELHVPDSDTASPSSLNNIILISDKTILDFAFATNTASLNPGIISPFYHYILRIIPGEYINYSTLLLQVKI